MTKSGPAESSLPPASAGGIRGALHAPHTASGPDTLLTASRIVRIPLERPDDAGWRALVAQAREAAGFANGLMAGWWAEAHGWQPKEGQSAYKDFAGTLSADVRDAVQAEAFGVWRRHKARVLRRDQRLPAFALDRALVVRGRNVRAVPDAVRPRLRLRLVGMKAGPAIELAVWAAALRKDRYLGMLWAALSSGTYRLSKVTLQLDQRRRKLYALCAYDRPLAAPRTGARSATLGPLEPDGSLLLRSAGALRDWTREVYEIRTKKAHYEGIVKRFRRGIGRGPRWRQLYRRRLPPTYGEWARGKLHQLSAAMILWCVAQEIDHLVILPLGDAEWPAAELERMVQYKAEHHGITIAEKDSVTDTTERAALGAIRKAQRDAGRARKAVRVLSETLSQTSQGKLRT